MSEDRRAEVAARLMRALRRPQRSYGERALGHFVIALEDDTVAHVCERVDQVGGTARVVIAVGADLHLFSWEHQDASDTPLFDAIESQSVDPATTMSMLISLVTSWPESRHSIRVQEGGRVQLFDGERLLAPA